MPEFIVLAQVPPLLIITLPENVLIPAVLVRNVMVPETEVAPETVKLKPPTVSDDEAAILRDAQAAAVVTVTVFEPSIKTSSPATGTLAPGAPPDDIDHVLVELQFPVATE